MTDQPPESWAERVVTRFERPLLAYACRMLHGDRVGAQDAVQETFLRLCRADRDSIEPRLAAWLFSVCRSRVIDMQRTRSATPTDPSTFDFPDRAPAVAQTLCDAEERTLLSAGVARLTAKQQEVLRLRLDAGLSYREIAEVTGVTVSNVGFHLHEAVCNLRRHMTG